MWTDYYDNGRTQFRSVWADENYGGNWCLTWVDNLTVSEAYVAACNDVPLYQDDWGTS